MAGEDDGFERVEAAGVIAEEEGRKDGDGYGRGEGTRDGGAGHIIVVVADTMPLVYLDVFCLGCTQSSGFASQSPLPLPSPSSRT